MEADTETEYESIVHVIKYLLRTTEQNLSDLDKQLKDEILREFAMYIMNYKHRV